jgi:hypothetical protein
MYQPIRVDEFDHSIAVGVALIAIVLIASSFLISW